MTEFVQGGVEQGADDRVDRRNAGRRRLRRHVLPQLVDIFVADRYCVLAIEGVGLAVTPCQRYFQRPGKSERAEEFLQLLERAALLQSLVYPLMGGILRKPIADIRATE